MDNSDRSFVSTLPADIVMHVEQQCQRLRDLSQLIVLADWRLCREGGSLTADLSQWETVSLNEKGQIAWERGRTEIWLGLQLELPTSLQNFPLVGMSCRLALTWWAEVAQVFVDRVLVQTGDLFDHSPRILLTPAVAPGTTVDVRLRLVSPGHDIGAVMRSKLVFESLEPTPEPGWVADELVVMVKQAASFAPKKLAEIAGTIDRIDYALLTQNSNTFTQHILDIKRQVKSILDSEPTPSNSLAGIDRELGISRSKIHLLGHAHLDMAWLWEVAETWAVAERTFDSALNLQQSFPNLTFCHSTPALYEWIEINKPELFDRILSQIATGTWEVVGGMWIEPDLNLISGESIARQIIYGQRYNRSKFGKHTRVAWLPDTFGFCWQLPQLLLQGKIDYFVTQKFAWNDTTKFPHLLFWWEAPDGSRILSLMSSEIGEGIDPLKMIDYANNWQTNTQIDESLWLFGVGDHGGGPTRDMLELADRWSQSDVFPDLEFTTAIAYLDKLVSREDSRSYPVWKDELYLEFHRGCFTTHADQKRSNRQCEDLLYQAELWSSLACIVNNTSYPAELKLQLETAWKQTLFNQFHDIIPGTAIEPVYVTANEAWENVERITTQLISDALNRIGDRTSLPDPPTVSAIPILVFNALNWQRTAVINLAVSIAEVGIDWKIYDLDGNILPCQLSADRIWAIADLPSIGYRLFWLAPFVTLGALPQATTLSTETGDSSDFIFKNQFVRVEIDRQTGDIARIWDEIAQREVLAPEGGNHLQAFTDAGQYWDAWNIDPQYAQKPLPPSRLKSIEWRERGELRQCIRVVRELAGCDFQQDYILDAHSPILQIKTRVDWQAEHVLIKANFPLNLTADRVTYETACGAIERTTKPETAAEKAKWEVPAHRWADLTDNSGEYGVSLLNDCKYGYDAGSDYLRLTLLRSSRWPDPIADRGYHEFTYAIYPHAGSWQAAATVRKGYELNSPLQVLQLESAGTSTEQTLPPASSFLDLSADNLVMMAFKPSEDPAQAWVLRCYECHGGAAKIDLTGELGLEIDRVVDLFDEPELAPPDLSIDPWQIRSFGLK
jgi:alpha-mannosidase